MNIEIHQPELENLIRQRMNSGVFQSVEDVLLHDLTIAAAAEANDKQTGADLVAAMQACPIKDINLEPERYPMSVRDVSF
jgi:hypothetical protein